MTRSENSTTVRSFSRRLTGLGLAATGRVSPALAGRLGARLFLTPPRHPAPAREEAALGAGEPMAFSAAGVRLAAWRFGTGPAVLLVHGWGGRAGQLAPLVPALRAAGLSAVLLDGPGHGRSGGRLASIVHFADAISEVAPRVGAVAAVGHSLGGAGLARALAQGLALDAAVLLGPTRSPTLWLERFGDALALSPAVRGAVHADLEARLGVAVEAVDAVREAPGQKVPVLVVHDRDDREVPWAEGAAIAGAWPGARLHTTRGLGHRRILRDPAVAEEVAGFLGAHLRRCACGRLATEGGRCASCALADHLADRGGRRALLAG